MEDKNVQYTYVDEFLNIISQATDKKSVRSYVTALKRDVSNFRLAAYKNPGTNFARICNYNANKIEKMLNRALNG